jgi:Flp pilus assembly protein TadD
LANALAGVPGRAPDAIAHLEEALRLRPDFAEAHNNLAVLYAGSGRLSDAISHLETALKLQPSFEDARKNLDLFRALQRR